MIITRLQWAFIVCLLSFSAMAISCDERSGKTTTHPVDTVKKPDPAHTEKHARQIYKDFSEFYSAFSSAVDRSDWENLAELTNFPFVLKGELDDEGQVVFDKNGFIGAIDELLREEVYLTINDELVATNYRKIIFTWENQRHVDGNKVQIFGIQFSNTSDGWEFSKITTHVHIIEKFSERK